ncbi:MAG: outer membrane protein transport protein [bacterium]|nr:outer membrane protein transport protein [bacterium]
MRRSSQIVTLLIVVLFAGSVFASGVALTGIGARAMALGGNFRGIADDWSAMFWNPAGLTQIKGLHFGFSTEAIMSGANYTFSNHPTMPFSVFRSGETEKESKTHLIPAAGFVYGTEKMSFGLGIYVPFGLGAKWNVLNTSSYNPAYPEIDHEDDLKVIAIQPTVAFKLGDKLSVGLGVNLTLADIIIRKPTLTPNSVIFDPNYAALRGAFQAYGLTPLLDSTYNHIVTEQELTGDGMGFGVNFGIQYDVTEDLTVGISGVYYNTIGLDGNINATTYGAVADPALVGGLDQLLDGMIAQGMMSAADKAQIMAIYSGQKIVRYSDAKGDADLPLPMTVGFGLAYKGIEKLLVSADVSWTQWSSWDVIEIAMEDGSKSELVENWEDGIRMGLGLEYSLTEQLAFRAGYYTEPAAPPDETITIVIPDAGRRHSANFGFSYNFGLFKLFASYEHLLIGDRDVANWEFNPGASGFDNMAGKFKTSASNLMAGLNFNF